MSEQENNNNNDIGIAWQEFLSDGPVGEWFSDLDCEVYTRSYSGHQCMRVQLWHGVRLYCSHGECRSYTLHDPPEDEDFVEVVLDGETSAIINYWCRHCGEGHHLFALLFDCDNQAVRVFKFGQTPASGGPLPKSIEKLLEGSDRDMLMKGRKCERQSLGIGAMAYYRLVVEAMRPKILNQILDECTDADTQELIKAAILEQRYAESFKIAKDALPPFLIHNGHNPLAMLYGLISDDLHANTADDSRALSRSKNVLLIIATLLGELQTRRRARADYSAAVQNVAMSPGHRKGSVNRDKIGLKPDEPS